MQLIIMTGLPTSGKTTRAQELVAYLKSRIASSSPPPAPGSPSRVHLISDDTLSIPRAVYDLDALTLPGAAAAAHVRSGNASEKDARAQAYGAVKRVLTREDVVVLDHLSYVKGWRYQLHCEAKAARTHCCVLQVGCPVEVARAVNEERIRVWEGRGEGEGGVEVEVEKEGVGETKQWGGTSREDGAETKNTSTGDLDTQIQSLTLSPPSPSLPPPPYTPSNWQNLVFRYEEPNAMARWDSPLFVVTWTDTAAEAERTYAAIWDAVAGAGAAARPVRPNQATQQRGGVFGSGPRAGGAGDGGGGAVAAAGVAVGAAAGGEYLYVMDRETSEVVKAVADAARRGEEEGGGGEAVAVPRGGAGSGGGGGGKGRKGGGEGGEDEEELVVYLPTAKKVGLPQLQRLRRSFLGLHRGGIGLDRVGGGLAVDRIRENFVAYLNDSFENGG